MKVMVRSIYCFLLFTLCFSLLPTNVSAQMMTEREIKDQYEKARRKLDRNKNEQASKLFYELIENAEALPAYQTRSLYQLSVALFKQDLYLVALNYVMRFLRKAKKKNSGYFIRSLVRLTEIAEKIGDETLIVGMIGSIPLLKNAPKKGAVPLYFLTSFQGKMRRFVPILRKKRRFKRARYIKKFIRQINALRNSLSYFLARRYFLKGRYATAFRYLSLIKKNAQQNYFAKAKYLTAVMRARLADSMASKGKFKAGIKMNEKAIGLFQDILKLKLPGATTTLPKTAKSSPELLKQIKAYAQYGIARANYALGFSKSAMLKKPKSAKINYQRALRAYRDIPKNKGIPQAQSLFESAYTHFMMDQYHFALGQLIALESPYYTINFFPEMRILRALIYYRNCKYEDTKQTIKEFKKQYDPLKKKLGRLVAKKKNSNWRAKYHEYFKKQEALQRNKKKTDIPASIVVVVKGNKKLRNYRSLLVQLSRELRIIRKKGSSWRESNLGKRLIETASRLRLSLQDRAGDSIHYALKEVLTEITQQLATSSLIKIETLRRQRIELTRYAEGGGIEQDEYPYTIVTEQNHIYWPYQGEFWRDEVGFYRQFIQGECKR